MMDRVKEIETALPGRPACSPLTVALLDADPARWGVVGQATPMAIELLSSGATEPPEWVRFLVPGVNRGRSGRSFTVLNADQVTRASNAWKGAIDLICCYEHQFDRSKQNGQPAPAAAWIKELSAVGPDGSAGLWARIDWLPETAQLIRDRKYRYLSAVIEHDTAGNVTRLLRATLTNQPEMDTATALFSAQPRKDIALNATLLALLTALGITGVTTDEEAGRKLNPLVALLSALCKSLNIDTAALSAMTAESVATTLQKPLAEKIAVLSAAAKLDATAAPDAIVAGIRALGADPAQFVARSVYDDVATRLATLTAETKGRTIEEAIKAGKLTPAMKAWAETMTPEQLTAFLSSAPVLVNGQQQQQQQTGVATLTAEDKAAARLAGVTEEIFLAAKQAELEQLARRTAQLA